MLSTLLDWRPALVPREVRQAGVLAATDLRHPVFRPFDAVAANFGQVAFDRTWQIDAREGWRVVARFTGGVPALAERSNPGRVLLFTSDFDRRWNDFPLHPAFVPFTQELTRYLGAHAQPVSSYLVADVPAGTPAQPFPKRHGTCHHKQGWQEDRPERPEAAGHAAWTAPHDRAEIGGEREQRSRHRLRRAIAGEKLVVRYRA